MVLVINLFSEFFMYNVFQRLGLEDSKDQAMARVGALGLGLPKARAKEG